MSLIETVIEGTLELDEKPNLPAGRVKVVLRQEAEVVMPPDHPFWHRMKAMWAIPTMTENAPERARWKKFAP